ncbi:MAG: VWA domain-containing protein, partial [Rhodospirillales bacterium]
MRRAAATEGRLVENVMHFARALRGAGLKLGPGRVLDAVQALGSIGVVNKADFYWTLHAVFVSRRADREVFDQAFHLFWRNPELLQKMLSLVLPSIAGAEQTEAKEISRRLADALGSERGAGGEAREGEEKIEIDATLTWSDREMLRTMDFEQMSAEEFERAKRAVAKLALPLAEIA